MLAKDALRGININISVIKYCSALAQPISAYKVIAITTWPGIVRMGREVFAVVGEGCGLQLVWELATQGAPGSVSMQLHGWNTCQLASVVGIKDPFSVSASPSPQPIKMQHSGLKA